MAGLNVNRGAKRAREARADLGMRADEPVDDLLHLVEGGFAIAVSVALLPDGIEGVCWRADGEPMLWVNACEFAPRRRFTLAHELGHVRCGHDGSLIVETFETIDNRTTSNAEAQANAFAAEFLAPKAGILEMVDGKPTLEDAVLVAQRFRISTIAAAYRFVTLDLPNARRIEQEVRDGLHVPIWDDLNDDTEWTDELSMLRPHDLPRLSPLLEGSSLGALLSGAASVDDVAAGIGCDPAALADSLELLGV